KGFTVMLSNPSGSVVTPSVATVEIIEDESLVSLERCLPGPPELTGRLLVNIFGSVPGQWRVVGSSEWHISGETLEGVPFGDIDVEFSGVIGYKPPVSQTISISATNRLATTDGS
ncbi:MAG: hypothetical protein AAB363_07130, partial [Planctomycetota bacterium]